MGFNLGEYMGWGPIDQRVRYGAQVAEMHGDLQRHYTAGSLKPSVGSIFTLDEFVPALDALLNREVQGKAIFTVTDADRQA
jgi:NADPH:quinone reductase-like Zn-dependent oxidoreductase